MPLRVAFDMDGVFADMDAELHRQAVTLFGGNVASQMKLSSDAEPAEGDSPESVAALEAPSDRAGARLPADDILPPLLMNLGMTTRQQGRLWKHVEKIDGFWESLEEIDAGSVARLAALTLERRWEVVFLTKRPQCGNTTAQAQTQRWLRAKGFPMPSVCVVQGSRGKIADALGLDFVVDDRPDNCLDVALESKAKAILVWRDDERNLPVAARRLGIGVVKTVGECLDILAQLQSRPRDQPGVMNRIMRLLGVKSEPSTA